MILQNVYVIGEFILMHCSSL